MFPSQEDTAILNNEGATILLQWQYFYLFYINFLNTAFLQLLIPCKAYSPYLMTSAVSKSIPNCLFSEQNCAVEFDQIKVFLKSALH